MSAAAICLLFITAFGLVQGQAPNQTIIDQLASLLKFKTNTTEPFHTVNSSTESPMFGDSTLSGTTAVKHLPKFNTTARVLMADVASPDNDTFQFANEPTSSVNYTAEETDFPGWAWDGHWATNGTEGNVGETSTASAEIINTSPSTTSTTQFLNTTSNIVNTTESENEFANLLNSSSTERSITPTARNTTTDAETTSEVTTQPNINITNDLNVTISSTASNTSLELNTTVSVSTTESTVLLVNESTPAATTVSDQNITTTEQTPEMNTTFSNAGNETTDTTIAESSSPPSVSMTNAGTAGNSSLGSTTVSWIPSPGPETWHSLSPNGEQCQKLGFPSAALNRCGYCVGGSTGLKDDYGLGIDGSCREAHIDCSGRLGGNSFSDPCTGICISDGGSQFDSSGRDCRGICETESRVTLQPSFIKDPCAICVGKPFPTSSIYKDCTGKCYTPATKWMMAVQDNSTCGLCIAVDALGNGSLTDACGNCANLNISCACPSGQLDSCGVCGGDNTTCLLVFALSPPAVPSFNLTTVWVKGGALKNKHHTVCMLVRQDVPSDGSDEEVFPAVVDSNGIHCDVNATTGKYQFHLAILSETLNVISNKSASFIIYPAEAKANGIEPSSVELGVGNKIVNVTVKGKHLNSTGVVYCSLKDSESGNVTVVTSNTVGHPDDNVTCQIPLPAKSSVAFFEVSLDGARTIGGPYNITFVTPAPRVKNIVHFSDVSLVAVLFDKLVNIAKLTNCGAMLTRESLDLLDQDDNCTWASPKQLIIGLPRHVAGQSIVLHFQDGVIAAASEPYAVGAIELNVTIPAVNVNPMAVLQGPSVVPECASFFLYGHQSDTNGGGDLVSYNWTVSPADNKGLNDILQEATKEQKAYVNINSTLIAATPHVFSLNITTSNNHSNVANWTVSTSKSPIAILVLESSVDPNSGPIAVDQRIMLTARVDVAACVKLDGNASFQWRTTNPKAKFDFGQMASRSHVIEPFSLPSGENVTYTVRVWLGTDTGNSVNRSITFLTRPENLVAKIKGGPMLVVGTGSGDIVIDANGSGRSGRRTSRLVYQWTCLEESRNPCYSYENGSTATTLLIAQPYTLTPKLTIPANLLQADSVLNMNLVVIDEDRERSEPRNLTIEVHLGAVPLVVIESVRANGLESSLQDESQSIYVIPSKSTVVVSATVIHNNPIASVTWKFEPDILMEPMSEVVRISDTKTAAVLTLRPESLVTGASYQLKLAAVSEGHPEGSSVATLVILPPVTGCVLTIPPYTALSQVTAEVKSCSALKGLRPLSYRLLVQRNINQLAASLMPLISPQYHLPLTFLGPPAVTNTTTNVFILEVCHALGDCANFSSNAVAVMQPTPTDVALFGKTVMEMANRTAALGMYLEALALQSIYFMALEHDNSSQSAIAGEHIPSAIQAAQQLNTVPCKDPVCFSDMFNFIAVIPINNNDTAQRVFDVIRTAAVQLNASRIQLPISGGRKAIGTLERIFSFVNTSDNNATRSLMETENIIQQILARNLHFGDREEMMDDKGDRVAILVYSFLESDVMTSTHNRSLKVHFGNDIRDQYKLWDCIGINGKNESCMGVVAQVHMYPNFVPYKLDTNHSISDVVEISLLNPLTGANVKVIERDPDENPLTTVTLQLKKPPTDENFSPICHIWDPTSATWTVNGVTTQETDEGIVECQTGKLSPLVVLWIDPGLSAGAIAAIVVACIVFVVGVAVAAVLVHRRLTTKTLRVTPPNGIPMSYSEPRYH